MLEIRHGKQVLRRDFTSTADLSAHLKELAAEEREANLQAKDSSSKVGPETSPTGRIYIMEDLAPDYVAVLGDHFHMDPKFFMNQERTTIFGLSHQGSQQTPCLPSLVDPEKLFLMKYYELRDFHMIDRFNMWCARTSRNISTTRSTRPDLQNLQFEPIGIIRRRCSFWSQVWRNKNWVG
jgi:hypothetical protein